jgi:phage repressor protein C with HTH and peptisase S24 domain
MTTLGERILTARQARKMRQNALAEHFSIRPVSVHQWETGQTQPDPRKLTALAEVLDVSLEWLLSGIGDMERASSKAKPVRAAKRPPEGYIPLRVAEVRPGMGGPADAFGEDGGQVEYFPPSLIPNLRGKPSDLWIMRVEGQSMSPYLEAGDIVIVDSSRTSPSQPGVFVVWDGFGMVCKWVERVVPSDPPAVRLVSHNPLFKPVELTIGEPGEAEAYIMGRVVWMSRKL